MIDIIINLISKWDRGRDLFSFPFLLSNSLNIEELHVNKNKPRKRRKHRRFSLLDTFSHECEQYVKMRIGISRMRSLQSARPLALLACETAWRMERRILELSALRTILTAQCFGVSRPGKKGRVNRSTDTSFSTYFSFVWLLWSFVPSTYWRQEIKGRGNISCVTAFSARFLL